MLDIFGLGLVLVLETEPRISCMLNSHTAYKLHPSPKLLITVKYPCTFFMCNGLYNRLFLKRKIKECRIYASVKQESWPLV